ncbi:type VI secretion system tube protein TssD [Pantoea sp. CCBC3-3-1]|uniref:Hcp family type VI secretion system effector n=1 Tax=Pantoea sp. CCBC3-3-1 TaxID=2490851 RepID=UPI0011BE2E9B|nr:type VI secretion system tube protein TssD [Pantoea sp. CCBC3-3-1]
MAIPVYLWLTDDAGNQVKGSVDINEREGSIEIVELMHSVSLPTDDKTGEIISRRIHSDYALIKETDNVSPYLYQAVTTGKYFKKAELKFYKINDNDQEAQYFTTTLENVRVNEIEPFMLDTKYPTFARHNHLEAVYLSYEKITWHYIDGNIIYSDSGNSRKSA